MPWGRHEPMPVRREPGVNARLRADAWPADPPRWRCIEPPDLAAVHAVEVQAYGHPWTLGNFADSLAASHWTDLCIAGRDGVRAYSVAMPALDELHLLNLTVAPAWQGRGLAATLLERLQQRTLLAGMRGVLLEVRPSNERARVLYARRGFVEIGRRRGYYPADAGQREDAIVMRLGLSAVRPAATATEDQHALD